RPQQLGKTYRCRLRAHAQHLHLGEALTVTILALVALATAELVNDELLVLTLAEDFCLHLGTSDERLAELGLVAFHRENLTERHFVAGVAFDAGNAKLVAFSGAELLGTGFEDCVCHREGGPFSRGP